ncbi:endosomal membrane protein [Tieghemostelium lacteum]|uniref:Copper transport protein n=1 Tax=Tieghemostelium lacteum TaxID=361077 RepID=A0A152A3P5_TIELA|nr:endosomal membrane protein [Tieghemostelium lacteum]|eukprot:KYR00829.1 endosomal membrane protein [Tieghemostelium lacteum]
MRKINSLLIIGCILINFIYYVKGDCISDPTTSNCVNYQYPDSSANADIATLCGSMSEMVVCSLQSACQQAGSTSGICDPWSLLADSCKYDMPGMSGCKTFKQICANGSVVNECTNYNSIAGIPKTSAINQNVYSICQDMSMQPCTECPLSNTTYPAFLKCNLFSVYSELCQQMPTMSQCSTWSTLCESSQTLAKSPVSSEFCSPPIKDQPPLMRMFFHTGFLDYVLFETWVPRTAGQFAGYWLLCFFFAILFECEKSLRAILEKRWDPNNNPNKETNALLNVNNDEMVSSKFLKGSYPPFTYRDIIRGFLHGLELTMSYLLMLVAMTFNVGLFFSVIAGTVVGNIAVGRFRSYKPKVTCCD